MIPAALSAEPSGETSPPPSELRGGAPPSADGLIVLKGVVSDCRRALSAGADAGDGSSSGNESGDSSDADCPADRGASAASAGPSGRGERTAGRAFSRPRTARAARAAALKETLQFVSESLLSIFAALDAEGSHGQAPAGSWGSGLGSSRPFHAVRLARCVLRAAATAAAAGHNTAAASSAAFAAVLSPPAARAIAALLSPASAVAMRDAALGTLSAALDHCLNESGTGTTSGEVLNVQDSAACAAAASEGILSADAFLATLAKLLLTGCPDLLSPPGVRGLGQQQPAGAAGTGGAAAVVAAAARAASPFLSAQTASGWDGAGGAQLSRNLRRMLSAAKAPGLEFDRVLLSSTQCPPCTSPFPACRFSQEASPPPPCQARISAAVATPGATPRASCYGSARSSRLSGCASSACGGVGGGAPRPPRSNP